MKHTAAQKRFDPTQIKVDEGLQGTRLASFSRRTLAYLMDWTLILVCSEYVWVLFPLGLLFLIVKRRLRATLRQGRRLMEVNLRYVDRRLDEHMISRRLRGRLVRHLRVYLYVLMYAPVALALAFTLVFLYNVVFPQAYASTIEETTAVLGTVFRPINDLGDGLNLLIRFFGAYLYFTLFTWQWQGQTPGKKLLRVRVARLNGKPLTFWNSSERATGYTASAALLLVGFFQYFWDRNCQTTHDKIAETLVVHHEPTGASLSLTEADAAE